MPAVATSPASVEHDARPRQVEEEKADIELEEGVRQSLEQQGKLKSNLQQQPFQLRTQKGGSITVFCFKQELVGDALEGLNDRGQARVIEEASKTDSDGNCLPHSMAQIAATWPNHQIDGYDMSNKVVVRSAVTSFVENMENVFPSHGTHYKS